MRIDIISIFPEMFQAIECCGMSRRAIECGALDLRLWNPRSWADGNYRRVDDRPYGGGPGMVMLAEPFRKTIRQIRDDGDDGDDSRVVYLTPQGEQLKQKKLRVLANEPRLVLLSGRYEGIDERLIEQEVDEEVSIGDYVLSGGELPAMVLVEGLVRYLPGVVGNEKSVLEESYSNGLLDWPHYTRPEEFFGQSVPPVLLGGDHDAIRKWRLQQSLGRTWERRPDLIETMTLNEEQQELLQLYQKEHNEKEVLR